MNPQHPSDDDLHQRLTDWAHEYGGDQYARLGYAGQGVLATVMQHGFLPDRSAARAPAKTPADDIERIVQLLEFNGRWREGRVLRAEYFLAGLSEDERLTRLRRCGLPMSRATYYTYLRTARTFLLGALCVRSGEALDA